MPKFLDLAAVTGFNAAAETFYSAGVLLHARIEPYSLSQTPYQKRMMATMESKLRECDDASSSDSQHLPPSDVLTPAAGCTVRGLTGPGDCAIPCASAAGKRRTASLPGRQTRGARRATARVAVDAEPLPASSSSRAGPLGPGDSRLAPPFSAPQHAGGPNGADGSSCCATTSLANHLSKRQITALLPPCVNEPLRVSDYSSLKTLYHLVSTMNTAYPDFDFSDTPAECFHRVSKSSIVHLISEHVYVCTAEAHALIHNQLWEAINMALNGLLDEAAIFVYVPCRDNEDPLHDESTLWSANVLFYHRVLRRILVLKFREESCLSISSSDESAVSSYSDMIAEDESDDTSFYMASAAANDFTSSSHFFMEA